MNSSLRKMGSENYNAAVQISLSDKEFHMKCRTILIGCLLVSSIPVSAHHGTPISYDMAKPFKVTAIVTEFKYANPHPSLFFDVTDDKGAIEHWVSEMRTNVSFLMRAGWTKKRSLEALAPGTK